MKSELIKSIDNKLAARFPFANKAATSKAITNLSQNGGLKLKEILLSIHALRAAVAFKNN